MRGGSYIKRGDKLERVEETAPAPDRTAVPEAQRVTTEGKAALKTKKES